MQQGFFLQTPGHIWWETVLKPASALTELSLKLLAEKKPHVYLHLSKHQRKTTAPWRRLTPENLLKCYKQLTTRANRSINKAKQAFGPEPQRVLAAHPSSTWVSGRKVLRAQRVFTKGWLMLHKQHSLGIHTCKDTRSSSVLVTHATRAPSLPSFSYIQRKFISQWWSF